MAKPPEVIPADEISPAVMNLVREHGLAGAIVANLMTLVALSRYGLMPTAKKMAAEQVRVCRLALEMHAPEMLAVLNDMDAKREKPNA